MTAIKGFNIGRGALRALSHAQGQLSCNHKQMLLFFGLDALAAIAAHDRSNAIRNACPQAFADLEKHRLYLENSQKRGAMFAWDLEAALKDTRAGLAEVSAYCRARTLGPGDSNDFRRPQTLAEAAAAYLEMADDIGRQDVTPLRRASKVNPCTSAEFIAEYMLVLSDRLDEKARRGAVYGSFSGRLLELRSKIKNNIPDPAGPLYEIGERRISAVYNLMSLLSQVGDLAKSLRDSMQKLGDRDPQLLQGLECLFHTAAVYDWQQFETVPPGAKRTPPPDNILRLRL